LPRWPVAVAAARSETKEVAVTETSQRPARARAGDLVIVSGHRVGDAERIGEILEVFAQDGREHYRVRWDDHESLFYPSNDTTIRRKTVWRNRHET
jgi:hypothetical protein